MVEKPKIFVVAGILLNTAGQVLIAERPEHLDQGGLWEFPGGKREEGETSLAALQRELDEELNIKVTRAEPYLRQNHEYPQRFVALEFYKVIAWEGRARGAEGQPVKWVSPQNLTEYAFPAANELVVARLSGES